MKNSVFILCLIAAFSVASQAQSSPFSVMNTTPNVQSERAKQAALELYFSNSGVIQGSNPDAAVILQTETSSNATYQVTIEDSNDEAESWIVLISVVLRKDGTVQEIREQTEDLTASIAPTDLKNWQTLATEVAMQLYQDNTGGIQGSAPEASSVKLLSTNAKISKYRLSIYDGNDEGESWEVIYTLEMANYSPLVLHITESFPETAGE